MHVTTGNDFLKFQSNLNYLEIILIGFLEFLKRFQMYI